MTKKNLIVALAISENCEREAYALRSFLECLNIQVITYWIARPNDFIGVLSGTDLMSPIDYLILCFHGDHDAFLLPKLAPEIYTDDEPHTHAFGAQYIEKYAKLDKVKVITIGCALGGDLLSQAFLNSGCSVYIAPKDYILGSAVLIFMMRYFYEILEQQRDEREAFNIAINLDHDTAIFQRYSKD